MEPLRNCGRCGKPLLGTIDELDPCSCGGTGCSGFLCPTCWDRWGRHEGEPRQVPGMKKRKS